MTVAGIAASRRPSIHATRSASAPPLPDAHVPWPRWSPSPTHPAPKRKKETLPTSAEQSVRPVLGGGGVGGGGGVWMDGGIYDLYLSTVSFTIVDPAMNEEREGPPHRTATPPLSDLM